MATNVPTTIPELTAWGQSHAPLWNSNQALIGLSMPQVTAFTDAFDDFNTNRIAADDARLASKLATAKLDESRVTFRALAGVYVNVIKAYAEATNNDDVYVLAGVSPNDQPGVVPLPNTAETFTANVNPDGSITVKWKAAQPQGVTGVQYNVHRRFSQSDSFTLIGNVGSAKSYTDVTLPYGTDAVQYMVQPTRNNVLGPQSDVFSLQFGTSGPGLSITGESIAKMAA